MPREKTAAAMISLPSPAGVYLVDPAQSELRLLVYRAGPLARLGHNHVMVNQTLTGRILVASTIEASVFSLSASASGFVVDDALIRAEEGADFDGEVSDEAKLGTRRNMLSAAVLNADAFPMIDIASVTISPDSAAGTMSARVTISVAGHQSTVDVTFIVEGDEGRLSASGTLQLRQTAIGLTPYSLMLGALQVQDAMTLKVKITALHAPA